MMLTGAGGVIGTIAIANLREKHPRGVVYLMGTILGRSGHRTGGVVPAIRHRVAVDAPRRSRQHLPHDSGPVAHAGSHGQPGTGRV